MRRTFIGVVATALSLFVLPMASAAQEIRLSGSLEAEGPIQVGFLTVMVEAAAAETEFLTGEANDFAFSIPSTEPVLVLIATGSGRMQPFYLEPGADVRLEHVGEGDEARLQVSGPGSEGPALMLGGAYEEAWKERLTMLSGATQAGPDRASFEEYLAMVDRAAQEMDEVVRNAGLSELYEQILLADNLPRKDRGRAWALDRYELTEAQAEAVHEANAADLLRYAEVPGAGHAMRYVESLGDLLDGMYLDLVRSIDGTTSPSGFYHFRRSAATTPALRDALSTELMYSLLRSDDYDRDMAELVEDFSRTATNAKARAFIEGFASKRGKLAPGTAAPALVAMQLDGTMLELTELEGRTVLMTVWGSWCYWSRDELPHLEALRQRMAETDPDIVFLNVGWDLEGPWREAIEEFGLGGTNVLSTEEIRAEWSMTGTPDFIVIGPGGTIVTTDTPRPSVDNGEALAEVLRATAGR